MSGKTQQLKKWLLIAGGTASVIAGIIGIIIPVLPTTPFLLLAAICYMHGSERLYMALIRNRLCGSYIRNYLEGKGMTLKAKLLTLALLWVIIGVTAGLVVPTLWIRIVLLTVGIGVTIHICWIHTPLNSHSTKVRERQYRINNN